MTHDHTRLLCPACEANAADIKRLRTALEQIRDEFPDSAGFTDARMIATDALEQKGSGT